MRSATRPAPRTSWSASAACSVPPTSGYGDTLARVTAGSILIVHTERRTQRTVQRILGGIGYRLDVADDLAQAERLLAPIAPALVVVDGSAAEAPGIAAFLAAAAARGSEACM